MDDIQIPKYFIYKRIQYMGEVVIKHYAMEGMCNDKLGACKLFVEGPDDLIVIPVGDIKIRIKSIKELDEYEERNNQ